MLVVLLLLSAKWASAQEFELVRHQVQLGETIRMIAVKYKVPPSEIYKLNKFAVDGIHQGQVLQIMVPKKEEPVAESTEEPTQENTQTTSETSVAGNNTTTTTTTTTTTIRRRKKQPGETVASQETSGEPSLGSQGAATTHIVASGETLFGIARQYNISVDDLKAQNAEILKVGLRPGQVLTIIGGMPESTAPATGNEAQVSEAVSGGNPKSVTH